MSSAREQILGRVRAATSALPERTAHPAYEVTLPNSKRTPEARDPESLRSHFLAQLKGASGLPLESWETLAELVQGEATSIGYCAPQFVDKLRAVWPDAPVETTFDRTQVDLYSFAITPAWGAIAETGTIILTDTSSPSRLAALAPWLHLAIVPADRVFPTVTDAVAALPDDPSVVFVTGPSKTADIEGILIQGVHGPGRQAALVE